MAKFNPEILERRCNGKRCPVKEQPVTKITSKEEAILRKKNHEEYKNKLESSEKPKSERQSFEQFIQENKHLLD